MSEINAELKSRLVTGHRQDGRCVYDPKVKAEIVRICMRPDVSVARVAMQCGINANLLHSWIGKRRDACDMQPAAVRVPAVANAATDVVPAFSPIRIEAVKAEAIAAQQAMLRLHVRLPNGVAFDVGEASLEELSPIIRVLGSMSCSGSTTR